jgi:hypothetical protein
MIPGVLVPLKCDYQGENGYVQPPPFFRSLLQTHILRRKCFHRMPKRSDQISGMLQHAPRLGSMELCGSDFVHNIMCGTLLPSISRYGVRGILVARLYPRMCFELRQVLHRIGLPNECVRRPSPGLPVQEEYEEWLYVRRGSFALQPVLLSHECDRELRCL